ncbi:forkhead domain-containing protein 3 [Elsinoe australis]|uniref:Forkhead domain-containing protein 3 n=1 Tax=Elsinoe australis TaxID=40998 RepID=A0A4U7AVX7_9PEZI|nr:forkhead domain-containing protein 3 [Elsinoe australis]
MATTASNAPAAFGLLQTPSFPQHSPYMTDALVKTEFDTTDDNTAALASSPFNVASFNPFEAETVNQQEEIAPAPAPSRSSIDEMMGNLRGRSESASMNFHGDMDMYSEAVSAQMADSVQADLESYAAEEPAAVEPQPMQAYAKLQFEDGDFYVNTHSVELGRDREASKREKRHKKRAKRREAMEDVDVGETPAHSVHAKMREFKGISGSNVSEGGLIGVSVYSDSEDEARHARRRRRRGLGLTSQDSSHSQSIAPANILHNPNSLGLEDDIFAEDAQSLVVPAPEVPLIPIFRPSHGQRSNISRKHVRIQYNHDKACWELHALGRNGTFVDGNVVSQGDSARLHHDSHIQIQAISIVFKLPDVAKYDEEAAGESYESDSDVEKLESSPEGVNRAVKEASGTPSDLEEEIPRDRPKLKLSLSKRGQALDKKSAKPAKISLKSSKSKDKAKVSPPAPVVDEPVVEEAEVRASIEDTSETKPSMEVPGVPATPAANLAPGSVLEGLAPEEIPQKRKGPGRPPKNGVMSKRDEAIIKRKKKELQKMGLEIPPLAELLAMARAESGTTAKKPGEEDENGVIIPGTAGGESASAGPGEGSAKPQTAAEIEAAKARKMAAKSPSPQKPESEYTEEELKKPQKTYVVLIHDALSNSATGIMDLQQIYDAIQKMYPYYKYRSQTQGWQSSIRHNLIGSEAFEEAGKIGKGRLWKINPNYNIDKEKKRRQPTPPPSDNKPAYQYPYQQGQYSNQGYPPYRPSPYGTPYGPPTTTLPNGAKPPPSYGQQRNGTYYSPYASQPQNGQAQQSPYGAQSRPPYPHPPAPNQAPNGQAPAASTPQPPNAARTNTQPPPSQGQAGAQQAPSAGSAPPSGPPRPPPQQEGIGNNDTIEEIMAYHKRYLGQFRPGPEQDAARDLFRKAVSRHIDQNKVHGAYISDEEKKVADVIGEIITRNKGKPRQTVPPPQGQPQSQQQPPAQHPPGQAPGAARPAAAPAHPPGPPVPQSGTPQPRTYAAPPTTAPHAPMTAPMTAPVAQTSQPGPQAAPAAPATIDLTGGPHETPHGPLPATRVPATAPTNGTSATSTPIPAAAAAHPAPPATAPVAASTPTPVNAGPLQAQAPSAAGAKRSADEATEEPDAKRSRM